MFLLQQDVKEIVEATSDDIPGSDIDFEKNLEVVSSINKGTVTIKQALQTIKSRLSNKNPNVAIRTLILIDFLIKNCGSSFVQVVFDSDLLDKLEQLMDTKAREKALYYTQNWNFLTIDLNLPIKHFYERMQQIYNFPPKENQPKLLLETNLPPAWKDSETCQRCRDSFTAFNRKHHCRNCGGCFCQGCSSKTSVIPKWNIEEEVRVCETCYQQLKNPNSSVEKSKKNYDVGQEDEDLQRAIRESLAFSHNEPVKKPVRDNRSAVEQEDEDLQRAIRESLKLQESTRESRPVQRSPSPEPQPIINSQPAEIQYNYVPVKKNIAKIEIENVKLFCELIERTEKVIGESGFAHINIIELQTLFAKVVGLHPKLVTEIGELGDRYKKLYDLNLEITEVVGQYDKLLQNRFLYSKGIFLVIQVLSSSIMHRIPLLSRQAVYQPNTMPLFLPMVSHPITLHPSHHFLQRQLCLKMLTMLLINLQSNFRHLLRLDSIMLDKHLYHIAQSLPILYILHLMSPPQDHTMHNRRCQAKYLCQDMPHL
jgi:growth factor-regulated tyrosine kinase substrate